MATQEKKVYFDFEQAYKAIRNKVKGDYSRLSLIDELKDNHGLDVTDQTLRNINKSLPKTFAVVTVLSEKSGIPLKKLIKTVQNE